MSQGKKGLYLEMVFCFQTCSDFFWLFVRKTCDQQNLLKFEAEGPEFAKFEITRIIQIQISNCEKFENKVFQNEVIENWPFRIKSTTFW